MDKFSWKILKTGADKGRRWRKPRAQSIEELVDSVPKPGVEDIDDIEIPEPEEQTPEPQPEPEEQTPEPEDGSESWIDQLTPVQAPEPQQDTPAKPESAPIPTPEVPPAKEQTEEEIDAAAELRRIKQQQELKERLSGLKTVDPEVAEELLDTIVNPVVSAIEERHKKETEALRQQLEQVRTHSDTVANNLTAKERSSLMANTNAKIQKVYPKAYDILNSTQFTEFLDASSNPYATEKKSDILKRAYASGDADYVINTINEFKNSIQKPKPAVSADATGASGTSKSSSGGKKMTAAEFQAKRAKLRAAPQTPETRRKLRVLSETYTKQLQG